MDPSLDNLEIARRLGIALAVGALPGLERQRRQTPNGRRSFAGLRTFTLISLFGAVSAWISLAVFSWFIAVAFLGFATIISISCRTLSEREEEVGTTTEIAAFVAFALGALAFTGRLEIAVALAVVVTAILSEKSALHALATRFSDEELHTTIQFAILTLVVFPFLPDRTIPLLGTQALNPRTVWRMVVLISAVSFAGYLLMKGLGARRGIGLTGLLGGLVSSTAVTVSFARRSREAPSLARPFALASVLACAVAALRVLLLVGVVNPGLLPRVAATVGAVGVTGMLCAAALYFGGRGRVQDGVDLRNPLRLAPVLRFGLLFAVILFAADLARSSSSTAGLFVTGALAGVASLDAIALSMAHLAGETARHAAAATTILLAVFASLLFKTLIAVVSGERRFGRIVTAAFGAMAAAGAGAFWASRLAG